jgi:Uncharacterised nucleotidyltransferase
MISELFEMTSHGAPAPAFSEAEWRELLAFADRTQLTLHLRGIPGLPQWLVKEIETRYARNAERRRRLREAYAEVAWALSTAGIEFVLLKGFTHERPMWGRLPTCGRLPTGLDEAGKRVQYDLDLLTFPGDVARAREAIERLGYAPHGAQSLSEEHARPLVRPSNWSWRGDYFDPEMPIPVELHESAWSTEHDRIHLPGMDEFWNRRGFIEVDGLRIPAFAEVDRLAFAALHVLRHILRHDARPAHVLELARFLEAWADDARRWNEWRDSHPPELRALQSVAFRFAYEWFGCALPAAAKQPKPVDAWFKNFAWSPVVNLTSPNKDTVWLHLALVKSWRDRVRVFCDRLVPLRRPHEEFFRRLRYHARALAPALASGVRWWRRRDAASTASEISDWKRRRV